MDSPDRYNYDHFGAHHFLGEAAKTIAGVGVQPGQTAPDFTLPLAGGGTFMLSAHRDRPVLLRFGSYT